jgi:hypothetical protein
VGDGNRIGDQLRNNHAGWRNVRAVRQARAPLFPPDDSEILLHPRRMGGVQKVWRHGKAGIWITSTTELGHARPPFRNNRTGYAVSVLWMIKPCRMPFVITKTRRTGFSQTIGLLH